MLEDSTRISWVSVTETKRKAFSWRADIRAEADLICLLGWRSVQASLFSESRRLLAALTMLSRTSWMYWDLL